MLTKHKMEKRYWKDLKHKLICELECFEAKICECHRISDKDVDVIKDLLESLYYLDCLTKGHHMYEMYEGEIEEDIEVKSKMKAKVIE